MKQRFSYLDLLLIAKELKPAITNQRLNNIYTVDSNPRHILFKFDLKDQKLLVFLDPGYRIHSTFFQHATTPQPSFFVNKLRNHLRQRRVTDVRVYPESRCMDIEFNEGRFTLIIEFFAGGNVILVDTDRKILAIMRHPTSTEFDPSEPYPISSSSSLDQKRVISMPSKESLEALMPIKKVAKVLFPKYFQSSLSLLEYSLRVNGIDPKSDCDDINQLETALTDFVTRTNAIACSEQAKGYVLRAPDDSAMEYEPFIEYFEQQKAESAALKITEFNTYNEAIDNYYGSMLSSRQESRLAELEKTAARRLEAARNEKQSRVEGLDKVYEENQLKGRLIEANAHIVTAAIDSVNQLLLQGTDWGSIKDLITAETARGNEVASSICGFDFAKKRISVKLDNAEDNDSNSKPISISIDLDQSAFANAREYFNIRRAAVVKKEKTLDQADKAFKMAQKKIAQDLQKKLSGLNKQQGALHTVRPKYWFEKFYWFLTSDGFIVIAGRDKLQNTLLLNRYFAEKDILVHCDEVGAALTIIKARPGTEISPQAIDQAAAFTILSSEAWGSKSHSSAWWLPRAIVPRLLPNGNPISMKEVVTLPKKQFVSPVNTDLGVGLIWQLKSSESESSEPLSAINDATELGESESEEEFPDTELVSDEEFSDTELNSEEDISEFEEKEEEEQTLSDESSRSPSPEADESSPEPLPAVESPGSTEPKPELESEVGATVESIKVDKLTLEPKSANKVQEKPPASAAKVRGKAKKLQKMKKYLDQDDEDREKAMDRLGTVKGLQRAEKERQEKEAEQQRQAEMQKLRETREREKILKIVMGDDVEAMDYPMNLVTKTPADDRIKAIVPVCAPMKALAGVDFKIKVIPGPLKKGKTVSEALRIILDTNASASSETKAKLLESVKSEDLQQSVPQARLQLSVVGRLSKGTSVKYQPGKGSSKPTASKKSGSKGSSKGKSKK